MEAYIEIKHYDKDGNLYDIWNRKVNGYNLVRMVIDVWQTAKVERFEKTKISLQFKQS